MNAFRSVFRGKRYLFVYRCEKCGAEIKFTHKVVRIGERHNQMGDRHPCDGRMVFVREEPRT